MNRVVPSIGHLVSLSDAHCHVQLVEPRLGGLTSSDSEGEVAGGITEINSSEYEGKKGRTTGGRRMRLRHAVLCGTHPQIDWAALKKLASSSTELTFSSALQCANHSSGNSLCEGVRNINNKDETNIIVGFGVHPWYVPEVGGEETDYVGKGQDACVRNADKMEYATDFAFQAAATPQQSHLCCSLSFILDELERLLRVFPKAIVGEIGLDKIRGPCESTQVAAFLAQMKLAADYCRPVSVHCVRHYGLLLKLLQELPAENTPPAIILHGFTGSFSIAQSLLRLKPKKFSKSNTKSFRIADRLFFGVGSKTTGSLKDFAERTLPLLCNPKKRILFESDMHYQVCTHSSLLNPTQGEYVRSCGAQQPLRPHSLDVANATSILVSLEEVLDSISVLLVSADLKARQGNATNPVANEEDVDLLEDVFVDAFAAVL